MRQRSINMSVIGYCRASTVDQSLDIQQAALKAAGCDLIRGEKRSGTTVAGRAELQTILEFLQPGDTLMVTRIDRLARSIGDLQDIVRTIKAKGAALKATEQPIDTSTAAGKAFLDMLGVFGEFETNLRRERQIEGIAKAKAEGVYKGRKPSVDVDQGAGAESAGHRRNRHRKAHGRWACERLSGLGSLRQGPPVFLLAVILAGPVAAQPVDAPAANSRTQTFVGAARFAHPHYGLLIRSASSHIGNSVI
jgi:DNA invertase Pin-like site-specific DNA recombinase